MKITTAILASCAGVLVLVQIHSVHAGQVTENNSTIPQSRMKAGSVNNGSKNNTALPTNQKQKGSNAAKSDTNWPWINHRSR
jgi:hypothetical protein